MMKKYSEIVAAVTIALVAVVALFLSTPYGLGVSPDSVMYLSAARSLSNGEGLQTLQWSGVYTFMSHFPPLFSLLLSIIPETIQKNAVYLQAITLFANSMLTFAIGKKIFSHRYVANVVQFIGTFAFPIIMVHSYVWTEPVFILGILLVTYLLSCYQKQQRKILLIGITLITMFLPLYRYAALFLIPFVWAAITYFTFRKSLSRIVAQIFFGIVLALPYVSWQKYTALHDASVRKLAFHPITQAHIVNGINTVSSWFFPGGRSTVINLIFLTLILVLLAVFLMRHFYDRNKSEKEKIAIVLGLPFWYIVFLVISISLFDVATPLDNRILAPEVIFLAFAVGLVADSFRTIKKYQSIVLFVPLFVLLMTSMYAGGKLLIQGYREGQEFADKQWEYSETIEGVKEIPADAFIVSNAREGIYARTGRSAAAVPYYIVGSGEPTEWFIHELQALTSHKPSYVVIFTRSFWNAGITPPEEVVRQSVSVLSETRFSDGVILKIE